MEGEDGEVVVACEPRARGWSREYARVSLERGVEGGSELHGRCRAATIEEDALPVSYTHLTLPTILLV